MVHCDTGTAIHDSIRVKCVQSMQMCVCVYSLPGKTRVSDNILINNQKMAEEPTSHVLCIYSKQKDGQREGNWGSGGNHGEQVNASLIRA